ncbi:unnamed protein product, partial [Mesorhabditis spiculigera]
MSDAVTPPDDYEGHFVDPVEIVSSSVFIVIGLCTLPIYFRLTLYHWRHGFKTHYQKIFFVCFTNDLFNHYSQLFRTRLPTWGVNEWFWYVQVGVLPTTCGLIQSFSLQFQVLGTLLIAANRASSLAYPSKYEKFWSINTWRLLAAIALYCVIYSSPGVTNKYTYNRDSWGYYIPVTRRYNQVTTIMDKVVFPLCISYTFLALVLNIYTGYKLLTYSHKMGKPLSRRERVFHFATLLQFFVQLLNTGDLIITKTQKMSDFWVFFEFQPVFMDLCNFVPIWFLLLISAETRTIVRGKGTGREMAVTVMSQGPILTTAPATKSAWERGTKSAPTTMYS